MEMENIVNLILNSSVSIVVIAYFMYRDYKFVNQLSTSIQQLIDKMDYFITKEGGERDELKSR